MENSELQRIKQRYGIVGNYDELNRAIEIALKIAPVDLSVLISGENGVGKEIFPRIIHDHSRRKGKKYLAVNCGAIPDGTVDSELFGHEAGAFTSAVGRREGYFTTANGGTLFLDEVGELPLATQTRLLRVLETGEFIPVGSSEVKKTDVRIVAATNVNMQRAISEGKFREDLYYRLNSVSINVPPLRKRGTDIYLLFRKFALEMSEKYHMPPVRLDDNARAMLLDFSWPGNVRQLKNLAENMSVTSEERTITAELMRNYLPEQHHSGQLVSIQRESERHSFENEREILYQILFDLRRDVSELKKIVHDSRFPSTGDTTTGTAAPTGNVTLRHERTETYKPRTFAREDDTTILEAEEVCAEEPVATKPATRSLGEMERLSIQRALDAAGGNRRIAARELGISERTLYRKIKEYEAD